MPQVWLTHLRSRTKAPDDLQRQSGLEHCSYSLLMAVVGVAPATRNGGYLRDPPPRLAAHVQPLLACMLCQTARVSSSSNSSFCCFGATHSVKTMCRQPAMLSRPLVAHIHTSCRLCSRFITVSCRPLIRLPLPHRFVQRTTLPPPSARAPTPQLDPCLTAPTPPPSRPPPTGVPPALQGRGPPAQHQPVPP